MATGSTKRGLDAAKPLMHSHVALLSVVPSKPLAPRAASAPTGALWCSSQMRFTCSVGSRASSSSLTMDSSDCGVGNEKPLIPLRASCSACLCCRAAK